jgi:hypothetical protein
VLRLAQLVDGAGLTKGPELDWKETFVWDRRMGTGSTNGHGIDDVVKYLKKYKARMEWPYNVLADEWIKKGKAREALFFEDVVSKSELLK